MYECFFQYENKIVIAIAGNVFSAKVFIWNTYEINWVVFVKCSSYPADKDSVPLSPTKTNVSKDQISWMTRNMKLWNDYSQICQRKVGEQTEKNFEKREYLGNNLESSGNIQKNKKGTLKTVKGHFVW